MASKFNLLSLALPYQREVILDKHPFKVLNWSRQIGKSFTCAFCATLKAVSKPNQLVVYLSTGQRAADEAIKKCRQFADAVKVMTGGRTLYQASASCITYSNGSRIMSLPSSPTAIRGWTVSLLIADELSFWQQPEECWQSLAPTLTNRMAGDDKELMICSTPLGKNSLFYEICQKAKEEPGWRYFQTDIHSAVKAGLKADVGELHKLVPDPVQFSTEYECQFADSSSCLVDSSLLQWYDDGQEFSECYAGIDWGRTHDATAMAVVGKKDGKFWLCDLMVLHRIDYKRQLEAVKAMFQKYGCASVYGDAGGLGNPLMEDLNRNVSARIKPFTFTGSNKTPMYEYFRKCVFERKLMLKSDFRQDVLSDLSLVRQKLSDNGKVSYCAMRSSSSHADCISAIILALGAAHDKPASFTAPVGFARKSVLGSLVRRI